MSPKFLIIVPTFNEAKNVEKCLGDIFAKAPRAHVLIVDDRSPDGTAEVARKLAEKSSQIFVECRDKRYGYGPSCLWGMNWGLEQGYDVLMTMDADGSHPATEIEQVVGQAQKSEGVAIGSRYVKGSGIEGWDYRRRLLSLGANAYARALLRLPFNDITGGFNAYHRSALGRIHLNSISATGYAFIVELKWKLHQTSARFSEVPIVFRERVEGVSKMSKKIAFEGFLKVVKLALGLGPKAN